MKANETYSFVAGTRLVPDWLSFVQCYQPILGREAQAVYQYFWAFFDNGVGRYPFSRVLNHVDMGMHTLQTSMEMLSALDLLGVYQLEETYQLVLKAPLSVRDFLDYPLYRSLLIKRIGDAAVEQLSASLPPQDTRIEVQFSDVFDTAGVSPLKHVTDSATRFDMRAFQTLVARGGLRFHNETEDIVALYHLAETECWNFLQAYEIAKETAVNQTISIKRMRQKGQQKPTSIAEFSRAEQIVIQQSKQYTPQDFLTILKEKSHALITADERKCLKQMAELGLLDEVINIAVFYAFKKTATGNLTINYILKVANSLSYHQIASAEQAMQYLRNDGTKNRSTSASQKTVSNVPDWSQKELSQEMSEAERLQMEQLRRQMLAAEKKKEDEDEQHSTES